MNLPNYITLLRIVLIPFFVGLMIYGYNGIALAVFITACITDALDGMIARLTRTQTELGAFLDPIADKLLIVSAFITLVLLGMLPVWFVIIVISRDVILIIGGLVMYFMEYDFKARPSILGKATTFFQLSSVVLPLVIRLSGWDPDWMAYVIWPTAGFTIASGAHYVFRGTKIVG